MARILQPGGRKTRNNNHAVDTTTSTNHNPTRQRNLCLVGVCLVFAATLKHIYTFPSYSSLLLSRTTKEEEAIAEEKESVSPPLSNGDNNDEDEDDDERPGKKKGKIAILSSFVSKEDPTNVHDARFVDHLVNKACYADVWGYDFIYNTSWGFPDEIRGRNASSSSSTNSSNNNSNDTDTDTDTDTQRLCFLDWGHWHLVPHLIALAEKKKNEEKQKKDNYYYEWIMWTDNDYAFWDIAQPLETLLQEIEMNGLNNVNAIVPDDGHAPGSKGQFGFSSFTILIRNSNFGRTLLQNWMSFAKGLCPNGNYDGINGCQRQFNWKFSDQPGLWYAMGKTYSDLVEGSADFASASCNNQTGYLNVVGKWGGAFYFFNQMSEYFTKEGLIKSPDYSQIPKDQPILWSSFRKNTRSGIGVNANEMKIPEEDRQGVLGFHDKRLNGKLQQSQLQYCRAPVNDSGRGCQAGFKGEGGKGVFDLSCGNTSFVAERIPSMITSTTS